MSADEKKLEEISEEILAIRDPLGEVRRVAEALWREAGANSSQSFRDYWSAAEEILLSGTGDSQPYDPEWTPSESPESETLDSGIVNLINGNDELVSILASSFRAYLTDYEALCFTRLAESNCIVLKDGRLLGPFGMTEISALLAVLGGEYDARFLQQYENNLSNSPIDARVNYWISKITDFSRKDEALNYSQQNTIRRMIAQISNEPRVQEVKYSND